VLDGTFAKYALGDPEARLQLYDLAMASQACVCCRLAPQQKRALVELARERDKSRITLAIGDGANDVGMIQGAHVGVAVRGKEGHQAVQASDVAISQFRFLVPMLHCHGRRAYRRVATFLCYYVYKHVVLAVGDMCWAHQSRFTGEIAYPEWLSACYSLMFTSLPVIVILCFDQDLPDKVALAKPELYSEGLDRRYFSVPLFVSWVIAGIWHGSLAWLVPSLVLGAADASTEDWGGTFWLSSVASFTLVVLFVDLQLWLITLNPVALKTLAVLFVSLALYIVTLIILGHTLLGEQMQWQIVGVPLDLVTSGRAMATVLLTPLALLIDLAVVWAITCLRPSPLERARWTARAKMSRVRPGGLGAGTAEGPPEEGAQASPSSSSPAPAL